MYFVCYVRKWVCDYLIFTKNQSILQKLPLALLAFTLLSTNKQAAKLKPGNSATMSTLFLAPPDWNHTANIYEVILRQYTAEGNFAPSVLRTHFYQ